MFDDYNIGVQKCQEQRLNDVSQTTGKARPWREKKIANGRLEGVYQSLDEERYRKKAARCHSCGSVLIFGEHLKEDGQTYLKVKQINSCRVRLCPLCMWRRSRRIGHHLSAVLDVMETLPAFRYLYLTLTVPNVTGEQLPEAITHIVASFKRLVEYKRVSQSFQGWFRSLEVTHNLNVNSPSYDTYHPHIHVIGAVNYGYFNNGRYIDHAEYLDLWRKATRNPVITQVDIRKVTPKDGTTVGAAVAETAKYSVKDADFLVDDDELARRTVAYLDKALAGRRLIAFGGLMKQIHAGLKLGEAETEDIETVEETTTEVAERVYIWDFYRQDYFSK
jgi:plasmid rolling circle replication initiator protein Rep